MCSVKMWKCVNSATRLNGTQIFMIVMMSNDLGESSASSVSSVRKSFIHQSEIFKSAIRDFIYLPHV